MCADWTAHGFHAPPHLDLGIDYVDSGRVGVECKLFEPYGRSEHTRLKRAYLDLPDAWRDIPACRELAEELAERNADFTRLGPVQLLRHILGLKFGRPVEKVRLVYLYFDAIGDEGEEHRTELRRFQQRIAPDPIRFVPMTLQEFILRAASRCRPEHNEYVDYRRLVATKYDGSKTRRPGRPPTKPDIAALVVRMTTENPTWGYTRIRGGLKHLGHDVARNTIKAIQKDHGIEPAPLRRTATSWKTFLAAHWDRLAAADFFTVEVLTMTGLVRYVVLFVMKLKTRTVEIAGITRQPDANWMTQVART